MPPFSPPSFTVGTIVAVFVLVIVIVLSFMNLVPKEAALLIAAVCALKL